MTQRVSEVSGWHRHGEKISSGRRCPWLDSSHEHEQEERALRLLWVVISGTFRVENARYARRERLRDQEARRPPLVVP